MRGYLLVRVDGKAYGLPLARVREVGDLTEVLDVPRALRAMRGVTPLRGRLVPVVVRAVKEMPWILETLNVVRIESDPERGRRRVLEALKRIHAAA